MMGSTQRGHVLSCMNELCCSAPNDLFGGVGKSLTSCWRKAGVALLFQFVLPWSSLVRPPEPAGSDGFCVLREVLPSRVFLRI